MQLTVQDDFSVLSLKPEGPTSDLSEPSTGRSKEPELYKTCFEHQSLQAKKNALVNDDDYSFPDFLRLPAM